MTNKALFKAAMEQQNKASRALLQIRNPLVRDIRKAIPQEEKKKVCVVVSLQEFCTVQSLDADDYRIKTQAGIICEMLMSCKTVDDLIFIVRKLVREGRIWNGHRYLSINSVIQNVLCQYAKATDGIGRRLALTK